jgi:hypothetical protein
MMADVLGSVNILFQDFSFPLVLIGCPKTAICPSEPPIIGGLPRTSTPHFEDFAVPPLAAVDRSKPSSLACEGGRIMGRKRRFGKGEVKYF